MRNTCFINSATQTALHAGSSASWNSPEHVHRKGGHRQEGTGQWHLGKKRFQSRTPTYLVYIFKVCEHFLEAETIIQLNHGKNHHHHDQLQRPASIPSPVPPKYALTPPTLPLSTPLSALIGLFPPSEAAHFYVNEASAN